jgi:hypothetical protein
MEASRAPMASVEPAHPLAIDNLTRSPSLSLTSNPKRPDI